MIEKIILTEGDKMSSAWAKVQKYMDQRLAYLVSQLEGDKDPLQTAKLRGNIAELRALQALGKEHPLIQ